MLPSGVRSGFLFATLQPGGQGIYRALFAAQFYQLVNVLCKEHAFFQT